MTIVVIVIPYCYCCRCFPQFCIPCQ